METENMPIKSEPPDDYSDCGGSNFTQNGSCGGITMNGGTPGPSAGGNDISGNTDNPSGQDDGRHASPHPVFDNKNFTCLLCDVVCYSRDDLRRHLKVNHSNKTFNPSASTTANHDAFSNYVNFRYTCSVCGARFKTFKTYLSHNMSHRGAGSLHSQINEARMAAILGTSGKQSLSDYFEGTDDFPGSFTCNECKSVFLQRDSYAMHMMMRAMNETCQSAQPLVNKRDVSATEDSPVVDKATNQDSDGSPMTSPMPLADNGAASSAQQRCLEDVTCQVEQDEYLQSVLEKVFVKEKSVPRKLEDVQPAQDRKLCVFCAASFSDQDSLAMHVMSDHTAQMALPSTRKAVSRNHKPSQGYMQWLPTADVMGFSCKICREQFLTRDNLAMHVLSHAQEDGTRYEDGKGGREKRGRTSNDGNLALKVMRTVGRVEKPQPAAAHSDHTDIDSKQRSPMEFDGRLYCSVCSIQFYSAREYSWHTQSVHSDPQDGPLCLIKPASVVTEDKPTQPNDVATSRGQSMIRSNSFSVAETMRKGASPVRPHSVGHISGSLARDVRELMDGNTSDSKASESARESKKDEHMTNYSRSQKREKEVLGSKPNIESLSSQERKIIYSVFGKIFNKKEYDTSPSGSKEGPPVQDRVDSTTQEQEREHANTKTIGTDSTLRRREKVNSSSSEPDDKQRPVRKGTETAMCKFCEIVFLNKAIYYLHMGLHNVNNPWQCNVCGKTCENAIDFTAHVIHM